MTHHEYTTCDDCGRKMPQHAPFTIERAEDQLRLMDGSPILHACSTGCLVRLATAWHRGLDTKGPQTT